MNILSKHSASERKRLNSCLWGISLAVLAAAGLSCGEPADSGRASGRATTPDLGPGVAVATVCRNPIPNAEPRRFLFSQINAIIAKCPEIGVRAHVEKVETCAQANAFSTAYESYSSDHPDADCEVPQDFKIVTFQVERSAGTEVEESSAALYADPDYDSDFPNSPSPVVNIMPLKLDEGQLKPIDECAGTFIAKNWILTAAHCLKPDGRDETKLRFWNWLVQWGGRDVTAKVAYEEAFAAVQVPHPDFVAGGPNGHDVGLIYLPVSDGADRFLPPDISTHGAYLAEDATSVLADPTSVPSSDHPGLWTAGWSDGLAPKVTTNLQLNVSPVPVINLNDPNQPNTDATDVWTRLNPENSSGGHRACHGDSGGPLYWVQDERLVVLGVLNSAKNADPCGDPDALIRFARVDRPDIRDWINSTIWLWSMKSSCHPHADNAEGSSTNRFQCWGTPCGNGTTCEGADEDCLWSGADYAAAKCDPVICHGGCSCLVGECVDKKTLDAVNSM